MSEILSFNSREFSEIYHGFHSIELVFFLNSKLSSDCTYNFFVESVQTCKPGATGEPSERNSISSGEDEKEPLLQSKDEDSLHVPVEKNNTFVQTYKGPASVASPSNKAALSQSSNIQSSNISDEKAPATITFDTDSSTKSGDKIPSSRLVKEVQSPILEDKCADDTDDLSVTALTSDGKPLSKQRDNGLKTSTPDYVSVLSPKPTPDTPEDPTSTLQSVDTKTTRQNEVQDSKSNDKLNPSLNNSKEEASTLKSVDTKKTRENDEIPDSKSNKELIPSLNNSKEVASTLKSVDNKATSENDDVPDSKSNEKLNPSLNNSKEKASTFKSNDNQTTRENNEVPDSKPNEELNPSLNNSSEEASKFKSVDTQATRENDEVPDSISSDELNPFLNDSEEEEASPFKSVDKQTIRENEVPDSKSNDELNPFFNDSKSDLLSTSDSLPPKTSSK